MNNPKKSDEDRWDILKDKCNAPLNSLNVQMVILAYYFSFSQVPALMFAEKLFPPSEKKDDNSYVEAVTKLIKGYSTNPND